MSNLSQFCYLKNIERIILKPINFILKLNSKYNSFEDFIMQFETNPLHILIFAASMAADKPQNYFLVVAKGFKRQNTF